ncbi:hypothetical protein DSL72_009066 [Monilinia vaccinii-corymbosi]|uniref:Uncharacterized protein n=1 Tax=Monilinia vaccinii-corymbosi TaxID=61207 RepID=A0A8A3PQ03_9HELO|nr:hypothetical protein DSL72_009066 [Monilinia vaccinii-corymbosi]
MRRYTFATTFSRRSFKVTEIGPRYDGKRWRHELRGRENGQDEYVQRGTAFREDSESGQLERGGGGSQLQPAPKQPYWKRYEIKDTYRHVKTFFKAPEWMKPSWSKEDKLKEWWIGKHATEKSQSQEAYGDIYPLEIPTSHENDAVSDSSDMVSLIRRVGVGLPINLAQRRILLKEAKMVLGYKHVLRALQIRDPHELLRVLVKLSKVDNYGVNFSPLLNMPPNTFSEILRLLDPKHFFGRYKRLLKDFSHRDLLEMRMDTLDHDGNHRAYTVYLWHLHRIIMKRQVKYPLYLFEYRMLLKAAKFTGHQGVADLTWKSMLSNRFQVTESRRVLPDVECFNYYMATMCWSDVLSPFHSDKLRVVSHYKELRQWNVRPHALNRHRIGSDDGIRITVSQLFREMVAAGLIGNEETFRMLMVSASREGDLETAREILKKVWRVDIDDPKSSNNPELDKIVPDSPLYPSEKLIRTVAHIYCINNNLPMAMRVVDQISRQYSINISMETWQDLLEWTAVFARKRGSAFHIEKGFDEGILPPTGMTDVWVSMTSEPYNVRPTLPMYNIFIRNLISRRQIREAQVQIAEAYRLHNKLASRLHHYKILYENSLKRRKSDSAVTAIRQRDFIFHRLRLRTSRMRMRQWVNSIIYRPTKYLSKYHANWAFQEIPNIVGRYKSFLRGQISYQTYTGHVRLETGTPQEAKLRIWRRRYGDKGAKRRRLRRSLGRLLRRREHRHAQSRKAAGGSNQLAAKIVQDHRMSGAY